jgi:hypothetical protein
MGQHTMEYLLQKLNNVHIGQEGCLIMVAVDPPVVHTYIIGQPLHAKTYRKCTTNN